jgi:radical SAM protein with 4Fe4S-binding SPASM domain
MENLDNKSGENNFNFQWHINERCNLRCTHCYQEHYSNSDEMSFIDLKLVVDNLIRTLTKWNKKGKIAITGGEPLLKKELFPLLDYLDKCPQIANLYILTNGTLIDDEVCANIKNIPKVSRVQISLDGASSKTHDAIRGDGNFEKAKRAIRLLNSYDIKVNLMYTLQKGNRDDIPALFDLAIEEKINSLLIERFVPCGQGKQINSEMLSAPELQETFQYISRRADSEYDAGHPIMIVKQRPLWINVDAEKARYNSTLPLHKQLGGICSIGLDNLTILHDGTVLPCRRLNIPIGNLKDDSLFKIWYGSDVLWAIRDKRNLKGKCNSCELVPLCSGCRAMAYACTGDYLEEDPQCWK